MEVILASRPFYGPFVLQLPPPTSPLAANPRIPRHTSISKSLRKPRNFVLFVNVRARCSLKEEEESFPKVHSSEAKEEASLSTSTVTYRQTLGSIFKCISKQFLYAAIFIAIGFSPIRAVIAHAIAVPVASEVALEKKDGKKEKDVGDPMNITSYEYSDCTRSLLEKVSVLLRGIEEVRKGNGDVKKVQVAMKAVKSKKEELQEVIMNRLYENLRELRREKDGLVKRSEDIVDEIVKAKREYERLMAQADDDEGKGRTEKIKESVRELEEDYNAIWERVAEIEDQILRRETIALSVEVREISFIERECQQLVDKFIQEMRWKGRKRYDKDDTFLSCLII